MKHVLSALDFSVDELRAIFKRALEHKKGDRRNRLRGRRILLLFYEASSRTFTSFCAAIDDCGGSFIPIHSAVQFSSTVKGESLEDTVHVLSGQVDAIILRHPEAGAAAQAAAASRVPVINAGDGANEHPTQALLDLFTIWNAHKSDRFPKQSLHMLFFGDNLRSRAVRSLALLLAKQARAFDLNIETVTFAGLPTYGQPTADVVATLESSGIAVESHDSKFPTRHDIVYITRSQKERIRTGLKSPEGTCEKVSLKKVQLLPEHAIVMHPLPRVDELLPEVDGDQRAWYFKQADNGRPVRMALLELVLGGL